MSFAKQNTEEILIEYVADEHDEEKDFQPSFWFFNRRYYLSDFVRVHNNPWIGASEFPEFIHGMEADEYFHPLFIEIVDDEYVNVYEEKND